MRAEQVPAAQLKKMHRLHSQFFDNLDRYNRLSESGLEEWVFHPGMLFGSGEKWWGDGGNRNRPHEGLDMCYYRDKKGVLCCLGKYSKVPAMFSGEIVHVVDDFIGKTVFVRHAGIEGDKQLYVIYGHVQPCNQTGEMVGEGDVIAVIADARTMRKAPSAHLHVSIAWINTSLRESQLSWETMHNDRLCRLVDPLKIVGCRYSVENMRKACIIKNS